MISAIVPTILCAQLKMLRLEKKAKQIMSVFLSGLLSYGIHLNIFQTNAV